MAAVARSHKPRGSQPLVSVTCTGCGRRFLSGARTHTRCPECGRNLRVHRSARAARTSVVQRRPEIAARPAAVRQPPVFPQVRAAPALFTPAPLAPLAPLAGDPGDDDGLTFVTDHGRLVLAEWIGNELVPAQQLPAEWIAAQLRARSWQLQAHHSGRCQVVFPMRGIGGQPDWIEECQRRGEDHGVLMCNRCFEDLRTPYDL